MRRLAFESVLFALFWYSTLLNVSTWNARLAENLSVGCAYLPKTTTINGPAVEPLTTVVGLLLSKDLRGNDKIRLLHTFWAKRKKAKLFIWRLLQWLVFNMVFKGTFSAIAIKIIYHIIYHIEKSIIIQTFPIRGGSPVKFIQLVNILCAATIWRFSATSLVTSVD